MFLGFWIFVFLLKMHISADSLMHNVLLVLNFGRCQSIWVCKYTELLGNNSYLLLLWLILMHYHGTHEGSILLLSGPWCSIS